MIKGFVTSSAMTAWGESIGVYARVAESKEGINLLELQRDQDAPAGAGAQFMRALSAYADQRRKPVFATVVGWNEKLENYYRAFGFSPLERTRDEQTGDVLICRAASRLQ